MHYACFNFFIFNYYFRFSFSDQYLLFNLIITPSSIISDIVLSWCWDAGRWAQCAVVGGVILLSTILLLHLALALVPAATF